MPDSGGRAPAPAAADPARAGRVDVEALAARFVAVFPHLDARSAAVALALYRLLAQGQPVPWPALARATGWEEAALRALVGGWPGVFEEAAALTGFGGLSIRPVSRHRLTLAGRTLHTRCAWDTLFLPALLGGTAEVESACALTGVPVRLTVSAERAESREIPAPWLSMLAPDPGMVADLTQHF